MSIFRKRKEGLEDFSSLAVDFHNHVIPGIDDGSPSMEHTIGMLLKFKEMGYKKLVFTPHVMQDCYPNTPEIITEKLMKESNAALAMHLLMGLLSGAMTWR